MDTFHSGGTLHGRTFTVGDDYNEPKTLNSADLKDPR